MPSLVGSEMCIRDRSYLKQKEKLNQEIENTTAKIIKLEAEYELLKFKNMESGNQFVEHFKGKQKIKELSREMVGELVESVYVFDEERIEIVWKFADDFEKVIEAIQGK